MKKVIAVSLYLIIFQMFVFGQDSGIGQKYKSEQEGISGKLGITYSAFGKNDVVGSDDFFGGPGYSGDGFYTIGLSYMRPLNRWLDIESGFEFSKHNIIVTPNLPPNMDVLPYKREDMLVSIPVTVRANFLKYLFVNGGVLLDINVSSNNVINYQNGIGVMFGVGLNYNFNSGISVFINPYSKSHSLLSIPQKGYNKRLLETGVRVGVSYDLF